MPRVGIRRGFNARREPVVEHPPVARGHVGWVDFEGFDGVDEAQYGRHLFATINE